MPTVINPLSKWFATLDERTSKAFPIYRAKPIEPDAKRVKLVAERLRMDGEVVEPHGDQSFVVAMIYAGQSGTDTHNDYLTGFGHVSTDPTSPTFWAYTKAGC